MSRTGALFHSRSRFAVGERISMKYRLDKDEFGFAEGTVVRASRDSCEDNMFPWLTAVRFTEEAVVPQDN